MSIIQLQSSSLSQSDPASFKILFHKYEGFPKLPQCTSGCLKTKIFWQSSYILRRPQNFAKSSPYFWLQYIQSKVRGRIRKILWPSQNRVTHLFYEISWPFFLLKLVFGSLTSVTIVSSSFQSFTESANFMPFFCF